MSDSSKFLGKDADVRSVAAAQLKARERWDRRRGE